MKKQIKHLLLGGVLLALLYSFWYSLAWLQLCYGLALFLFGMQCIEEGLHKAAEGTLSRLLSKSTATPVKGLLFGMGATFVLQSSTLVSLLTMAFLSTGLIQLAGGIAVILGTNLGATSGIWLLALAGQNISLAPVAAPMLVLGILGGLFKGKARSFGRILIGIALILIGIDAIKTGFHDVGSLVDLASVDMNGAAEVAMFCGIGLLLTMLLQSSHATLILTLAALAGGQIGIAQAFAVAIGSNVGSSISTALVGMLGSERHGQQLALAHLIFNVVTALLALLLWLPLVALVQNLASALGLGQHILLQLALFHTLFNLLGLAIFWFWQKSLAQLLQRCLPEHEAVELLPSTVSNLAVANRKARYLSPNTLRSGDTALQAIFQEIHYLGNLSVEAICHILFIPASYLHQDKPETVLPVPVPPLTLDAQPLYEQHIKPLYCELLDFISQSDLDGSLQQAQLTQAQMTMLQLIHAVKDSKHLQKNMQYFLQQPHNNVAVYYLRLRQHLFQLLWLFRQASLPSATQLDKHVPSFVETLSQQVQALDVDFRHDVLIQLRQQHIDSWDVGSLMNDINYAHRIGLSLQEVLPSARAYQTKAA